jgi:GH15 family glucan-1,4-alpha-glucosidase
MTTSIPEIDGQGRNWDYRFCWLRDAYFVVRTLNRLGYIETMEDFLAYISNIVGSSEDGYLQPVYGIGLEARLTERQVATLKGYRGNQPVRIGNQAYEHDQHDGYGSVLLAATQAFFDQRLRRPAAQHTFHRLETIGEQAFALHAVPDAGLWEFRTKARVHTHSSVMCWAACDRLARIASQLSLTERATHWQVRADQIRETVLGRAWNDALGSFAASFGGDDIDASLLLMHEVGFIRPDDPRFAGTVAAVERELKRGPHLFRYVKADDFGRPENAFVVCTFWYIDALIAQERIAEARELFENMLACRNHLGLLSEDINPESKELWGNFPQTYSLVGLINCAMKLSKTWEDVV